MSRVDRSHLDAIAERHGEWQAEIRRQLAPALEITFSSAVKRGMMFHGGTAISELVKDADKWNPNDYDVLVRGKSEHPTAEELKPLMFELRSKLMAAGFKSWFTPAIHEGTLKLWAVPKGSNPKYDKQYPEVLDASAVPPSDFDRLRDLAEREAEAGSRRDGVLTVPSAYLKMSIHGEFARPNGYVTRWEKLYPRLVALYAAFPSISPEKRRPSAFTAGKKSLDSNAETKKRVLDAAAEHGWVVAGHEAVKRIADVPYRDLPDPPRPADLLVDDLDAALAALKKMGMTADIRIKPASVYMPTRHAIVTDANGAEACGLYETADCTSYNESRGMRVGNPDIVLSTLYANYIDDVARRPYYEKIVDGLVESLQQSSNRGLSRRFGATCSGI